MNLPEKGMNDWEYWLTCIRMLDRLCVRGRRKSCAARPQGKGRHAVSKINRVVSMKIARDATFWRKERG